ncbi:PPE family protein [Nocardia anaemiae]|uniref:PPE family protein n=1 Tax=Nocardia anaemiae TaxID=263910 RepID=UPI0007A3A737|nr:PPE domain-containing protein [Nocardia anaemiae]
MIWHALPPEINVGNLLGGPGVEMITAAAESYQNSAQTLMTTASNTASAMLDMGETWNGESGDLAQSAFSHHTKWLQQQAMVAQSVSGVLLTVAGEFSAAQSAMEMVGGWLAENRFEQGVLLLTNTGGQNAIPLLLNQLEYIAIWGAAAAVMDGYAGAVLPTLSTLPPPALPTPIVTDPGVPPPPPQFDVPVHTPKSGPNGKFDGSTNNDTTTNNDTNNTNTNNTNTDNNTGDTKTGNTDTGNTPTDTTESPTADPTADPSEVTSPLSDSGSYTGADGSAGQSGFFGTSPNSPTLAGLSGGVGSMVALNLARGGLGSMPGASTGFRMPSNWLRGPGTAFGASSNPSGAGPAGRGAPRKGAIAPKTQMRRRRDEERKPGKVFVPGEQLEVPVLEKPPVIGIIEYADQPDEVVTDQEVLVGVIENADDDSVSSESVLR